MMIMGSVVFFKMTPPIRARFAPRLPPFQKMSRNVSGEVAAEIEKLILNSLKK